MTRVVFYKEDKATRKDEKFSEYECKECMVFDSIAVLKGVTGNPAKAVRVPLFKISRMDTFE